MVPHDEISVFCRVTPPESELDRVLKELKEYVEQNIKQPLVLDLEPDNGAKIIISEAADVKGTVLNVTLCRRN